MLEASWNFCLWLGNLKGYKYADILTFRFFRTSEKNIFFSNQQILASMCRLLSVKQFVEDLEFQLEFRLFWFRFGMSSRDQTFEILIIKVFLFCLKKHMM